MPFQILPFINLLTITFHVMFTLHSLTTPFLKMSILILPCHFYHAILYHFLPYYFHFNLFCLTISVTKMASYLPIPFFTKLFLFKLYFTISIFLAYHVNFRDGSHAANLHVDLHWKGWTWNSIQDKQFFLSKLCNIINLSYFLVG